MSVYVLAVPIGVITGLRCMTAPAAVSWAARLGWLPLENTWLSFLRFRGDAIYPQRPRDRRADQRQAAEDAEPQSGRAVRDASAGGRDVRCGHWH
jgi:hypothetical protein